MGLFDPTTHLASHTRKTFLGTKKVVTLCGKEFDEETAEPGSWSPGWIASCGPCNRKNKK